MRWLKSSFYNVLSEVEEEKEWLLFNTLSGGLEVLSAHDGELLSQLMRGDMLLSFDDMEDTPLYKYLYEKGYITDISEPDRQRFVESYKAKKTRLYDEDVADIGLTIGTTITCNMGCPYCFEFEKPNKSLRDEETRDAILYYLEDMVSKAPVKRWRTMMVVWYGGEPMINAGAIEKLSPRLIDFCERHHIEYKASIITNGILLDEKNWAMLEQNRVSDLQVTVDGPEETHNKKRPLKNLKSENYTKILSNLGKKRPGMILTIRVNVDKEIARLWDRFFADLATYGIWPQQYREVKFSPSWLRPYEEITENSASDYLTNEEFFDELQRFRKKRVAVFNEWAEKEHLPMAKLRWELPVLQEDCTTWTSPYSVVIDPEGYVQKCWETIHDSKNHIHHVSEGFKGEDFKAYAAYDKVELNDICRNCLYMPVCDKLPCAFASLKHGKPDCTYWKLRLPSSLKDQYLLMKRSPEIIAAPFSTAAVQTGHSNK